MSDHLIFQGTDDYIVSNDLRNSVNISVALRRPLLIKGEPGTGKTVLAESIARSLGLRLIIWNIKSTTKAQDGLYVYDTVQRLYDSQFGEQNVSDIKRYIKLGKLGEAFASKEQIVLLIDEIDKADLEFPNDLLWELDMMNFYIPETGETIAASCRPIVIITSNAEKELPDAFLRRCIFHYIDFPDKEMMEEIVHVHFPELEKQLLAEALKSFYWLRSISGLQKKPSTSELLDWVQALTIGGIDPETISQEIPFLGALLKKNQDFDLALKQLHTRGIENPARAAKRSW
ncbi:MoxR family ATPase [Desulfosporosinus sp. PR]|uniref:AAA family ATPase n=1 Tax=Candidatus Desulfosporosinus nitrosoreducens TaxID=3401928 RepID=UPI0027EAA497|nr:MoxR family ATPase [Desulfosporosinus sp. PR]MDQ7095544.1 MoxR family ATPase [Desulfosporosinus sp. PR]